jgi:hypothetical protein
VGDMAEVAEPGAGRGGLSGILRGKVEPGGHPPQEADRKV